jgi:hypothetical protein
MHRNKFGTSILIALACLLFVPLAASAQSSIVGLVRDESGGVLPGVTVEAASPVLIEKVRSNVTDEQGRYRLVDLRPGTYRMTFSLTGFSTIVREGVELPANFTATVNVDLKVGTLQETVTVSGAAPVVDVQQASKTQVVTRDIMDALPTTRNLLSIGIVVPGIRMSTPDIGGSRAMEQPTMRGHGTTNRESTQFVDGQSIQGGESNTNPSYFDDALSAETSVTTSAIPAETTGGGIRLNVIPKDGGNTVSGAIFLGGTNGTWQSKNIDDALRKRGITTANGIAHIQNFNASMGGPILHDKLWFFMAIRHTSTDETVANVPKEIILPDGTVVRAILDQFIRDPLGRLTWQATSQNKVAAWWQRTFKRKGKEFGYGESAQTATQRDPKHGLYGVGGTKWTSTISSRLMLEGGYSTAFQKWSSLDQAGVDKVRGTPEWYANARRTDTALNTNFYPLCIYPTGCTGWTAGSNQYWKAHRMVYSSAVSYVTGTHNLKTGFQWSRGPADEEYWRNGDLVLNYVNGKPSTVTVYNTPTFAHPYVNRDLGIYVQDAWTIKRLTLNPGVRAEYFKSGMRESSPGAGRFAPARSFAAQPGLPDWGPDWAPRFSAAYDLFGDGRTAIKGSVSKYFLAWTTGWANRYANSFQSTDSRNWFDADLIPGTSTISGAALPTNGDNIAQDNEIGPSSSTTFGVRADRNPAEGLKRVSDWEYTASLQHQVMSGVSVTAAYFHRSYRDLEMTDRTLISLSDYTSFTVPMPSFSIDPTLTGVLDPSETLTVYNLNSAKRSVYSAAQVDVNTKDESIYNGLEVSFSARLKRGTVFGGWTMDHNLSVYCASDDNPNGVTTTDLNLGETVSRGGRFCDNTQFSVPFIHEFKVSGNYPLPYGVDFGAVVQSYPGASRVITWSPAASLYPGGSRTNAETIILNKPGSLYQPRYNQLDINFRKSFRVGRKRFSLQADFFNALNGNAIWTTNNTIGSSLGQVTSILPGRIPRIAFQMQW